LAEPGYECISRDPRSNTVFVISGAKELGVVSPEAAKHMRTNGSASEPGMFALEISNPVLDAPILVNEELAFGRQSA
jgi:hypothetical protein